VDQYCEYFNTVSLGTYEQREEIPMSPSAGVRSNSRTAERNPEGLCCLSGVCVCAPVDERVLECALEIIEREFT
jgi:hypothetical protein